MGNGSGLNINGKLEPGSGWSWDLLRGSHTRAEGRKKQESETSPRAKHFADRDVNSPRAALSACLREAWPDAHCDGLWEPQGKFKICLLAFVFKASVVRVTLDRFGDQEDPAGLHTQQL